MHLEMLLWLGTLLTYHWGQDTGGHARVLCMCSQSALVEWALPIPPFIILSMVHCIKILVELNIATLHHG